MTDFREMENDAMESLKEISDVSWFVDQHLDKLDYLFKSLDVSRKRKRCLNIADLNSRRPYTSQKVRIIQAVDIDEFLNNNIRQTTFIRNPSKSLNERQMERQKYKIKQGTYMKQRSGERSPIRIKNNHQFYKNMKGILEKNFTVDGLSLLREPREIDPMHSPQSSMRNTKNKRVYMGRPIYSSKEKKRLFLHQSQKSSISSGNNIQMVPQPK